MFTKNYNTTIAFTQAETWVRKLRYDYEHNIIQDYDFEKGIVYLSEEELLDLLHVINYDNPIGHDVKHVRLLNENNVRVDDTWFQMLPRKNYNAYNENKQNERNVVKMEDVKIEVKQPGKIKEFITKHKKTIVKVGIGLGAGLAGGLLLAKAFAGSKKALPESIVEGSFEEIPDYEWSVDSETNPENNSEENV
jgi:hypothetical protein